MANNFVAVNKTTSGGGSLAGSVTILSRALDSLAVMKAAMDNMTDATDWTTVEAQFGLPPGKGQTVYNLLAGTVADTNASSNLQNLIHWLGTVWTA